MANTPDSRTPRAAETREATGRVEVWSEPSKLPEPIHSDEFVYRWIRTSTLSQIDQTNVSTRFREGWVPVPKEDADALNLGMLVLDHKSRFPQNIEIGGLLLCKMPRHLADQRKEHYEQKARSQVQASDHNFMKQSDPRMPLLQPERSSTVTFGSGRPKV